MRFDRTDLFTLARDMLTGGGMAQPKADVVADLLIRTDELGVTTHGISMVPYYLPELASGAMAADGEIAVVSDRTAAMVWDAGYLPGHWVMDRALSVCMARARDHGLACLTIRRSHHIGCLSTLTRIAATQGLVCLIATSDPAGAWVAPFGGIDPVLTPNPFALGYPASPHPVLIDTCASITTVSNVRAHINTGRALAHPWMLDGQGHPTTDAGVVNQNPKGTILPVGGMDHGHKGFALGLMVETLTQALSAHGRAEAPTRWGANVFVQVMDPEAFGGLDGFLRETDHLNAACRASRPLPGVDGVRIPGDRAQAALDRAARSGVPVTAEVWGRVAPLAESLGLTLPRPVG